MATYTPNHNLGKPDLSDPFGDFRELFNDNMDILDQIGGASLATLSDVNIVTPVDGEILKYDSATQKWVNGTGGGGGGGSATIDTLYTNPSPSVPTTITLSKSMQGYDFICLSGYRNNMTAYRSDRLYLVKGLTQGAIIADVDDAYYAWYTVTSDTVLTSAGANIIIDKVYGIKTGGSDIDYLTVIDGKVNIIFDDGN